MEILLAARAHGEAKINQAHRIISSYHNVIRFDVSVEDILRVTVIDSLEKALHVVGGLLLREHLIDLLADLVEKGHSIDVLHDQVDVHCVIIGLIVLDDVGVVECVQSCNLVHDVRQILPQSFLVQYFYCNFYVCVMLIRCQEYFAEVASAKDLSFRIDMVILFQFMNTLLPETLTSNQLLILILVLLNRWL